MNYIRRQSEEDWQLFEIVRPTGRMPFSIALKAADTIERVQIYNQCRLLIAGGVPANTERGNPSLRAWSAKCKGCRTKTTFWILREVEHGWRMYLVANEPKREVYFLWAVQKKKDKRDISDFQRLCNFKDELDAGEAHCVKFNIPERIRA